MVDDGAAVVLDAEPWWLEDGVVVAREMLEGMKEPVPVGPAVLVELDTGNDAQLVVVEVAVEVRPGQLEAVGLHWVMVTVLVRVWVEVVVVSASWAATRERPVARTATMLLNCIVSDWCDWSRWT
jgi:hypothetical protein